MSTLHTAVPRPVSYPAVEVAPETFFVRQAFPTAEDPRTIYMASLVVRGAEPTIVDTGPAAMRDVWLETVFSLVDPLDVRWVFLSHDDVDHCGNVTAVLAYCPNATLVTSAFAVSRMTADVDLPYHRMLWLNHGDRIGAGDRSFELVDAPVYDNPTTCGLLDRSSGVYWAVDAFAAPVPTEEPPAFAEDLPEETWAAPLGAVALKSTPWLEGVTTEWFGERLDRLAGWQPSVIASSHGPCLRTETLARAIEIYRALPGRTPPYASEADALAALLRAHHP